MKIPKPTSMTLSILKKDIIYAVQNEAYINGEAVKEEKPSFYTRMQIYEEQMDNIEMYFNEAESRVVDMLAECLDAPTGDPVLTDAVPDSISYSLTLPPLFDLNQVNGLKHSIFRYLVDYILYKWYQTRWGDMAGTYYAASEEDVSQLRHRLEARTVPLRLRTHPLGF